MSTTEERTFGGQTQVASLRRVLVRAPGSVDLGRWPEFGWLAEPEPALAAEQHEVFCGILADAGAEVLFASSNVADDPDAVYVCDPAIMSDRGAMVLRLGKEGRRSESTAIAEDLTALGVPVAFEMAKPATAEGGDTMWLDERTLLVGRSYRTNDAGIQALREALRRVEVLAFDLPRLKGPDACLHLLSLLSPLADDLVVAYVPLMPIRLLELLAEREIEIVEVPEDEFESMGPNVLALAPRVALAVDGNPKTRRRMERAGVEVIVYEGSDISHKGEGGPTCLTRSLLRG
ncbi:MAG TPA: arginine deiminase family protein [Actinomycetota bacterium]